MTGQVTIPATATSAQRATVETLMSRVELRDIDIDEDDPDDLVFSGTEDDGPAVGYIHPSGKVSWIVGG